MRVKGIEMTLVANEQVKVIRRRALRVAYSVRSRRWVWLRTGGVLQARRIPSRTHVRQSAFALPSDQNNDAARLATPPAAERARPEMPTLPAQSSA
jgi:hypothetical protein